LAKEPTRKPKINGLELFMALASPLAVIGFIVFCIVFLDRFISAENIRERLRENGRAVTATILRDDGEDDYIWAVYVDQNGEERMGLIRGEDYPPRVMDGLTDGASLRVIYDTRFGGDGEVIVAGHEHEYRLYPGYYGDLFWPLLVVWLIAAYNPGLLLFDLEGSSGEGAA